MGTAEVAALAAGQMSDAPEASDEPEEKVIVGRRKYDDDWYNSMPGVAKLFLQGGFALIVAVLFYNMVSAQGRMIADLLVSTEKRAAEDRAATEKRATEDRALYREELKLQRERITLLEAKLDTVQESMRSATTALMKATETLQSGTRSLERATEAKNKE